MAIHLRIPLLLLATLVLGLSGRPEVNRNSDEQHQLLLGGMEEADIHEEDVQQAIDFSVGVYNQENNDPFFSRVMHVVRSRKQVSSGINYYLDLEIGRTTCIKSQSNLLECPFNEHPDEQRKTFCSFQVYTVPWLHTISMAQYSCHND